MVHQTFDFACPEGAIREIVGPCQVVLPKISEEARQPDVTQVAPADHDARPRKQHRDLTESTGCCQAGSRSPEQRRRPGYADAVNCAIVSAAHGFPDPMRRRTADSRPTVQCRQNVKNLVSARRRRTPADGWRRSVPPDWYRSAIIPDDEYRCLGQGRPIPP